MENNKLKKCPNCNQFKSYDLFNKSKVGKLKLSGYCKQCTNEKKTQWRKDNPERVKEYKRDPINKDRSAKINRERYRNDPEYREKRLEQNRNRRKLPKAKEVERRYEKFKNETNSNYKLTKCLRARARHAISKLKRSLNVEIKKCASTIDLLGCSISDLKIYLESKFQSGMSWENHGFGDDKWHIDHIKPCAAFDLTKEEEQKACFHYTNMQPLWQKDNLSKSDWY